LIRQTVIVDEYIPEEEVPFYFCAADAVLLTYIMGFTSHTSSLLDAAQYYLPVIAINIGTTGEDVKTWNLGMTYTPEDPNSLKDAIVLFFKMSDNEKQAIRLELQKFASSLSWKQVAATHIALYRGLVR